MTDEAAQKRLVEIRDRLMHLSEMVTVIHIERSRLEHERHAICKAQMEKREALNGGKRDAV